MNDEFLHALRRDPPPRFASELKRRLDQQAWRRLRASILRTIVGVVLIGGAAMAALLLRDRSEPSHETASIAPTVARSPFARAGQPVAATPGVDRQVTQTPDTPRQPEATESAVADIPVAVITSPLPRPLAQALVGRLPKFGYLAQPRLMNMEDDEALRTLCGGNTDFAIVSRRMSREELAPCQKWGIEIAEWMLGYQAVVLTAGPTAKPLSLTPRDVFRALAERIPDPAEPARLIDNPHLTWHDVDARFDERDISVTTVTLDAAFLRLVMEPGCETYPWIRSLKNVDRPRYDDICHRMRTDNRYNGFALQDNMLTWQLRREPGRLAVLDYWIYLENRKDLLGTMLEGPAPSLASLTDGTYRAARPVYVYALREHLNWNAAARKLANELTSEDAVGPQGYLLSSGLVPPSPPESRKR